MGKYLPIFEREFVYDKTRYTVKAKPVRIDTADGAAHDSYRELRDQLVEMAILKLAAECRAKVVQMDGLFTVFFTRKLYCRSRLIFKGMIYRKATPIFPTRLIRGRDY